MVFDVMRDTVFNDLFSPETMFRLLIENYIFGVGWVGTNVYIFDTLPLPLCLLQICTLYLVHIRPPITVTMLTIE